MKTLNTVVAVICVAGWAVVVYLLWTDFVVPENPKGNWDRALTLFNTITPVAFTALGVLLGTSVQQKNAAEAKKEASQAKKETSAVKTSALKLAEAAEKAKQQGFSDDINAELSEAIGAVRALASAGA